MINSAEITNKNRDARKKKKKKTPQNKSVARATQLYVSHNWKKTEKVF